MSLYQLQKLIYHVNRDPERRARYRRDAGDFLKGYELSEDETHAVLNVDTKMLYMMGVHALLLRPFTLLHKVSNEAYAKAVQGSE